jgi:hypothetical protein
MRHKSLHKVMTCANELAACTLRVRKHIKKASNEANFKLVVVPTGLGNETDRNLRKQITSKSGYSMSFMVSIWGLWFPSCVRTMSAAFSTSTFVMQWPR